MFVNDVPLTNLQPHPSQTLFHDLDGPEWEELVKDVRERGIQQPITVSKRTGTLVIVDGHQRVRAACEAGLTTIPAVQQKYEDEREETLALVMANIRRRHLTREERRGVIAEMLKLYPEKSNNQHAKEIGVSDMTVKAVRQELEATSQIRKLDKTVGADGRERTTTPRRQEREDAIPPASDDERQPLVDKPQENLAAQRLAANMARNDYTPRPKPPATTTPEPEEEEDDPFAELPDMEFIHGKTDEELEAEDRAGGWVGPQPGQRSVMEPLISNRTNTLAKTLRQLLNFRDDGRDVLDREDAQLLNLELLVFHAKELLEEWLADTKAENAQEQARTISVDALN